MIECRSKGRKNLSGLNVLTLSHAQETEKKKKTFTSYDWFFYLHVGAKSFERKKETRNKCRKQTQALILVARIFFQYFRMFVFLFQLHQNCSENFFNNTMATAKKVGKIFEIGLLNSKLRNNSWGLLFLLNFSFEFFDRSVSPPFFSVSFTFLKITNGRAE